MKLKTLFLTTICFSGLTLMAQQSEGNYEAKAPEQVGKLTTSSFMQINAKGAQMVNAITPTSDKLSAADMALFNQIAMGSMRQLAISRAAVNKSTNDIVKMLAQSEVDEQKAMSVKLQEVASAKGITMPAEVDATVNVLVEKINNATAAEVDVLYLEEGGIKGHEQLQATMQTVKDSANDATLKALSEATMPVIKTHLDVSKEERKAMKK